MDACIEIQSCAVCVPSLVPVLCPKPLELGESRICGLASAILVKFGAKILAQAYFEAL